MARSRSSPRVLAPIRVEPKVSVLEGVPFAAFDPDIEQMVVDLHRTQTPFCITEVALADQVVLCASDELLELTEYRREDLISHSCQTLFSAGPNVLQSFDQWHQSTMKGITTEEAITPYTKTGRKYSALLTLTPLHAHANSMVTHCIWALADVTSSDSATLTQLDCHLPEVEPLPSLEKKGPWSRNRLVPSPAMKPLMHLPQPPIRRLSGNLRIDTGTPDSLVNSFSAKNTTAVLHVNHDLHVVLCSSSCKGVFGYSPSEIVGKPLDTILAPTEDSNVWQWGSKARYVKAIHHCRNELQMLAMVGAVETILQQDCMPVTFQDISDLPMVQTFIQEQSESVAQYKQFVHFIFHEARQPFSVLMLGLDHISGTCQTLAQDCLSGASADQVIGSHSMEAQLQDLTATTRDIIATGQAMHRILNDALMLEKLAEHKLHIEPCPTKVEDIIWAARHQTKALFQEKEITLNAEVDSCLQGVEAEFDQCRIQQVMLNLLTNAQKFTARGGMVKMQLQCMALDNEMVDIKVSVEDNGIGIPDSVQQQLFQPFVQHHAGKLQGGGGTGLGLAIIKGIIDAHGGTVGIRSSPGHGSEFWFQLRIPRCQSVTRIPRSPPKVFTPKPPVMTRRASLGCLPGGKADVLVVDDQALNRKYLQKMIVQQNLTVALAISGEEVLERFKAGERWRLILTDYTMAQITGPEMTQQLIALGCDAAIVGITGSTSPQEVQHFLDAGAREVFSKPCRLTEVQQCVAKYLMTARVRQPEAAVPMPGPHSFRPMPPPHRGH